MPTSPPSLRRHRGRGALHPLRFLILWGGLAACYSKPEADEGRSSIPGVEAKPKGDAMTDMPGMATSASGAKSEASESDKDDAGAASKSEVVFTAAQVQHGKVRWESVTMTTAAGTVSVPGQVEPNEDRTARLGAPASGRVIAVHVRPGQRVARGQLLVTLVSPEAGIAQSDLSKATAALTAMRAQAAYARSARERAVRLLALKAIPRQDFERAIADDAAAQATLTQAESEVLRARSTAGQLGGGATVTGEMALRSPLDGVVLTRTAAPGAVVEAGAPLVVVIDATRLWLTVNAPESLAGGFHRGSALRFNVPAFPGEIFTARVEAVGAGLDPETRTLSVRAAVISGLARLKPEMLATVTVAGGSAVRAVVVPEDAVQLVEGKPSVFLAKPDDRGGATFTARSVETGSRSGGRVAITRGLSGGEVVVTSGTFAVKAQLQKGNMPKMEM